MSYSTPVLSGSIPNPATQPLQGVLDWTESTDPSEGGSLLLHFDVSPFVDSSGNGLVITAHGSPTLDTTTQKMGLGAIALANNLNYLTTPVASSGPIDFGTGDFTIEFWFMVPSLGVDAPNVDPICVAGDTAVSWFIAQNETSPTLYSMSFYTSIGGTEYACAIPTFALTLGTWYSMAFCRQGTSLYAFLNGVMGVVQTIPSGAVSAPATMSIGHSTSLGGNNQAFNLDEFRITKGAALYTANYTPQQYPFGVSAAGYDLYRDGVSIALLGAVLTYTDNVPSTGTYAYNVAAYDPTIPGDISPESNEVDLTYMQAVIGFPNCIFDEAIYGGYFGGQLNLVEFTYMPGRTPFEEGATNLIINRYKQEPTDVRQRGVDFTQFVVPGELLQTVAVTGINAQGVPQAQTSPLVTPLVVTNVIIDPVTQLKFGYTVSGGQNGIEYTVQFTTTTNIQTETLEEIFSINIMIEDMFP